MIKKTRKAETEFSRRAFLSASVALPFATTARSVRLFAFRDNVLTIASPNGRVQFDLVADRDQLNYRLKFNNKAVIEDSRIGIVVDGIDLSEAVEVGKPERYKIKETYAWRGVHSRAVNHCNGATIPVKHKKSHAKYTLDVRTFNDGIAFRFLVPADGKTRVPDEATSFLIPPGSTVWLHDFEGHYEGIHKRKPIAEITEGEWAAPPLTFKLPDDVGYAAITEGALVNYSGMGLQADGRRGFKARLGHDHPVSYPFNLRYGAEEARRLAVPAAITGAITTPWRVVMIGSDLNTLVNCDIINNVSPPPDRKLFPAGFDTPWLRPGRAVWRYLDGGDATLEGMKEFSRLAGQLGFEHNVVEGFWHRWSEAEMRDFVEYSKQCNVGIWFWEHSKNLRSAEAREKFFGQCRRVRVVGAKIDFFDHEAKEIIDLYQALLRDAARFELMVVFHGANKPAGESRTWPNEMTREAIRGMEYRSMQTRSVHDTTLPFTRMLAGHADYTPMHFGERRRETSWAHQIASAAILTSRLLTYAAHPKSILENPAVDLIKSIPSVWDETIVLPMSAIGEIAAFARRRGSKWFLAIMNGPTARSVKIPLSFLGDGRHKAMLVRDRRDEAAAVTIEDLSATKGDSITVELRAGGGFIGRFSQS